jgi:hypothetical protein
VEVHAADPAAVYPDVAGLAARRARPHPGHGGEAVLRVQLAAHGPRQPRAPRVHGEPAPTRILYVVVYLRHLIRWFRLKRLQNYQLHIRCTLAEICNYRCGYREDWKGGAITVGNSVSPGQMNRINAR